MANDIIGGPELIDIKGRLFQFSPLNDFEFAAIDAWVSWRLERRCEAISDDGFSQLRTVAGVAQILYQSVHRNHPDTVVQLAEFIGAEKWDDTCDRIYDQWYKLNFEDFEFDTEIKEEVDKVQDKGKASNANSLYVALSRMYSWTPQQIGLLTPYQQMVYLMQGHMRERKKTLQFNSVEDYQKWLLTRPDTNGQQSTNRPDCEPRQVQ